MVGRKTFLLRVDDETLELVRSWAGDELRSLNGQIEFLLRKALRESGRLKAAGHTAPPPDTEEEPESE